MKKTFYILTSFVFLTDFVLCAENSNFLEEQLKPKTHPPYLYLKIHTQNRTTIKRAPTGIIEVNIDPRSDEIVRFGDIEVQSPKNIVGRKIKLGDMILSQAQTDEEFLETIRAWDKPVYEVVLGIANKENEDE